MLLTPPNHLHCHHPSSPGLCLLGQPEKIWKVLLVGKLVQPPGGKGMLLLSPCPGTLGAAAPRKVPSTQKADFSDRSSAQGIQKALREAAASVTKHPPPLGSSHRRGSAHATRSLALGQGLLRGRHRGAGWSISLPAGEVTASQGLRPLGRVGLSPVLQDFCPSLMAQPESKEKRRKNGG